MASRISVLEAKFVGVVNGRPRFDFTDGTASPPWLVKLANNGKVVDGQFLVSGKPLLPGQVVTGEDNG